MRLMTAHKILIGTAAVFFLYFAIDRGLEAWRGTGSMMAAALGLAAAAALGVYLRTLKGK